MNGMMDVGMPSKDDIRSKNRFREYLNSDILDAMYVCLRSGNRMTGMYYFESYQNDRRRGNGTRQRILSK